MLPVDLVMSRSQNPAAFTVQNTAGNQHNSGYFYIKILNLSIKKKQTKKTRWVLVMTLKSRWLVCKHEDSGRKEIAASLLLQLWKVEIENYRTNLARRLTILICVLWIWLRFYLKKKKKKKWANAWIFFSCIMLLFNYYHESNSLWSNMLYSIQVYVCV